MRDTNIMIGYHAHIYFIDAKQREHAKWLWETARDTIPGTVCTDWADKPVGPHPVPMCLIEFDNDNFDDVIQFLMLNRENLSILVHPLHGDPLAEHRDDSFWLGNQFPLKLSIFKR